VPDAHADDVLDGPAQDAFAEELDIARDRSEKAGDGGESGGFFRRRLAPTSATISPASSDSDSACSAVTLP